MEVSGLGCLGMSQRAGRPPAAVGLKRRGGNKKKGMWEAWGMRARWEICDDVVIQRWCLCLPVFLSLCCETNHDG